MTKELIDEVLREIGLEHIEEASAQEDPSTDSNQ